MKIKAKKKYKAFRKAEDSVSVYVFYGFVLMMLFSLLCSNFGAYGGALAFVFIIVVFFVVRFFIKVRGIKNNEK